MREVLIDRQEGIYYTLSVKKSILIIADPTQPQKRGKPWH